MKKTQIYLLLLAISILSVVACKNHHDEEDTTKPVLTISSPVSAVSIAGVVTISGVATDESLHEMSIIVTRDNDASELYTSTPEVHDLTSYSFTETWSPLGVVTDTPVTLTVVVEDHKENKVTQIVHFSVKP